METPLFRAAVVVAILLTSVSCRSEEDRTVPYLRVRLDGVGNDDAAFLVRSPSLSLVLNRQPAKDEYVESWLLYVEGTRIVSDADSVVETSVRIRIHVAEARDYRFAYSEAGAVDLEGFPSVRRRYGERGQALRSIPRDILDQVEFEVIVPQPCLAGEVVDCLTAIREAGGRFVSLRTRLGQVRGYLPAPGELVVESSTDQWPAVRHEPRLRQARPLPPG